MVLYLRLTPLTGVNEEPNHRTVSPCRDVCSVHLISGLNREVPVVSYESLARNNNTLTLKLGHVGRGGGSSA